MSSKRSGGRTARKEHRANSNSPPPDYAKGFASGTYQPLSEHDVRRIHSGALHVLETVGMGVIGDLPPGAKAIIEQGATLSDGGRLLFPRTMVEDTIAKTCRKWTLHGIDESRSIDITPGHTHYGTAGGAVNIRDFHTRQYRETTLKDLYDVTRLIDTLDNIHWCYRPLIARDMIQTETLDINTAYALITGTSKPLGITLGSAKSVETVIAMFDTVLGGEGKFKQAPCAHSVQGDGVPPLRFAYERCLIKEACIRAGMPLMIASAPQAGATAPAALAGTLVQVTAEALAGLVYVNAVAPGHPVTFAPWAFVSDLRTGAMSGGGAEQAMLSAASAQMGRFYDIPTSVPAGMADAKAPDAQSGSEKAYTNILAGLAGASMVHESAGMHAALMGCVLESFVIDNDMLGTIQRALRGIEVSDDTLSLDVIADVNLEGPGHYLGHAQTIELMESEYRYPDLADRQSIDAWQEEDAPDIESRARDYVEKTLSEHYPHHIGSDLDRNLREKFDIRLPREDMRSP